MVVLHLGSVFRRWVAVFCACLLLGAAVRWGLGAELSGGTLGLRGAVSRVPVSERVVALTFNVAATHAMALSNVLQAAGLPATVFISGHDAAANRAAVQSLAAAGAEVETLGWDGTAPGGQSAAALAASLRRAAASLAADTGTPPLFFRPPNGGVSGALLHAARAAGLGVVTQTATVGGADSALSAQVEVDLSPGAILNLPAGVSSTALADIADGLRLRGYEAVTLAGLFALAEGAAAVSVPSLT